MKVALILGTRPEAVKLAPVALLMRESHDFSCTVLATGQQREMLTEALAEFDLAPDIDLDVMQHNQSLAGLTARLLTRLEGAIEELKPDWIVVQGDTTTAMVGALTGFYKRSPVAHVEAGMRTGDNYSPFPEEVNRRIVSQCAALHFAPTPACRDNLLREGVPSARVLVTGNTVIDALLYIREQVRRHPSRLPDSLVGQLDGRRMLLVTSHRRESFGPRLEEICMALGELAQLYPDDALVLPVHPNPNVKGTIRRILGEHPNVLLIEPQPYRAFVELLDRAHLVLTDSGGIQEEAPSLGKPVLVLRDTTERPEGIASGNALLVGTERYNIVASARMVLEDADLYRRMSHAANPYGDGKAAAHIVEALRNYG
ncbi:MAG: UDP-N-acetylglucosamine 2-epimerase (non-hydrolyzing) [Chloroflexia bacterium]